VVDVTASAVDHVNVLTKYGLHECAEMVREPHIVVIEVSDEVAVGHHDADVLGAALVTRVLRKAHGVKTDAPVLELGTPLLHDGFHGLDVRGTVVYNPYLVVCICLVIDGLQRGG
jgi:hypothetical protein